MKNFRDYLKESEEAADNPVTGDVFAVNIREECLVESVVLEHAADGIVIAADDRMLEIFESYGISLEDVCMECGVSEGDCGCNEAEHVEEIAPVLGAIARAAAPFAAGTAVGAMADDDTNEARDPGEYGEEGDMAKNELQTIIRAAQKLTGMLDNNDDMPEWTQKKITKAADYVDTAADYISSQKERGIMEQPEDGSPVARAVLHRIMMQHPGVLATHGPERVLDAVDELAYHVGDVEEIGTSDVSGWTRDVIRMLAELPDEPMNVGDALDESGVAEGEIDDTWMNDKHKEFYKRNPHFKRNDRERVEVGRGTQLATRVNPSVKPAQVQKKPATRFGMGEANHADMRNAAGLTQTEWMQKLKSKGGKIVAQAKMPNGPVIGVLNGKRVAWRPAETNPAHRQQQPVQENEYQERYKRYRDDLEARVDRKMAKSRDRMGMGDFVSRRVQHANDLDDASREFWLNKYRNWQDYDNASYGSEISRKNTDAEDHRLRREIERGKIEKGTDVISKASDMMIDRIRNRPYEDQMSEAEYQGRKVQLGKPTRGDVKKFKVYVRDPKTGNVKKVNFGDPNMRIKKSNPARRKSFRARHNCDNPGPKTGARYWSCRAW
jgi:ribosomal protein L12E/L44/L45/RPP1/RPP2